MKRLAPGTKVRDKLTNEHAVIASVLDNPRAEAGYEYVIRFIRELDHPFKRGLECRIAHEVEEST